MGTEDLMQRSWLSRQRGQRCRSCTHILRHYQISSCLFRYKVSLGGRKVLIIVGHDSSKIASRIWVL